MTAAQKRLRDLKNRASTERGRMVELGRLTEHTDETRAEQDAIEAGTQDLERMLRAAQIAVDAEETEQRTERTADELASEDAETREMRELRGKIRLGNYIGAAIEQRAATGAELEFNQAQGIPANKFLLEMLAPAEQRATTDTDTATMPRTWLDRLFSGTAAMSLGVSFESVPGGAASYPVTATGPSAAQRGRTEATADGAWTVSVLELKPTRNGTRAVFTSEDAARIPGLESALVRDLRMALTEGIDRAMFLGDSGANENTADITGLTTATGLTEKTISQSGKVKGADVLQVFAELIDGKAAMSPADLRTVMAVGANTLWSHTLANTGASVDTTISEFLRRFGMSWVTRGDIETATAADDFGAFVGLGRGLDGAGVAAMWSTGELIRDIYSGAATGEIKLTLRTQWAFGLPRASNFARVKFTA